MIMNWKCFFGLIALLVISGCNQKKTSPTAVSETGRPTVIVVNYPLQYFAERIGGDFVEVQLAVPKGVDPAYWTPGEEALAAFQDADIILLNGAGYAQWLTKVSLPHSRLVNTTLAVQDRYIEIEGQTTHTHGPEGEHEHGEIAFTTWLDPVLAIEQANSIRQALARKLPDRDELFTERFQILKEEIQRMDREIETIVSKDPDRALLFSHPVYQYFEKYYGLKGNSVHWEPHQIPDGDMIHELEEILDSFPAVCMIWEGEPMPETMDQLSGYGIGSVVFDPCANTPEEGDYMSVMQQNLRNLQAAFLMDQP